MAVEWCPTVINIHWVWLSLSRLNRTAYTGLAHAAAWSGQLLTYNGRKKMAGIVLIRQQLQEDYSNSTGAMREVPCTSIAFITAPSSRYRVMWLVRLNGPVTQVPAGTTSMPPVLLPLLASPASPCTGPSSSA